MPSNNQYGFNDKQNKPKYIKPQRDIGPGNPMLRLRYAIKPTKEEIVRRIPRDRRKPYLLQRELADRINCSHRTVMNAEKEKRFPTQLGIFVNSQQLYFTYFPEPRDLGGGVMSGLTKHELQNNRRKDGKRKKKIRPYMGN